MRKHLESYLQSHRKQAGLSQQEVARVLGYGRDIPVSRHERLKAVPPLLVAIGYSILFKAQFPELFAGLFEVVEESVEKRLGELEHRLKKPLPKSAKKGLRARKVAWVSARRKELFRRASRGS